jgi:1,4-dihydroxy-2-naphthoate octaprenyltransferase
MKKYLQIWIMAARPKTLWASIAPVLIGTAMAYDKVYINIPAMIVTFVSAVLIQVATNYANDYFDFMKGTDKEDRIGPTRVTQAGLISPRSIKRAYISVFSMAFIFGLYLVWIAGWPVLIIGTLSILFGILYTAGPFPLGYNGLGDIFVFIFFGPLAVGGTYYIQTLDINWIVLVSGLAPGLLSTAILTVNNLRDIRTDKKCGKRTLAVRYGETFSRMEYMFCILFAGIIPFLICVINRDHIYSIVSSSILLFAIPMIRSVVINKIDARLNIILAQTGIILMVYSIIFSISWNL